MVCYRKSQFTLRRFNLRRIFLERIPDAKRGIGVYRFFGKVPQVKMWARVHIFCGG